MYFVALGSQKFPFDRLLQAMDGLLEQGVIAGPVYAQTGVSTYRPRHFTAVPFLSREEMLEAMDRCTAVITHGGTGIILSAVKRGKKVVAVPRSAAHGEHVDDHQLELIRRLAREQAIIPCYDPEQLGEVLTRLDSYPIRPFRSNTQVLLEDLSGYLTDLQSDWRNRR